MMHQDIMEQQLHCVRVCVVHDTSVVVLVSSWVSGYIGYYIHIQQERRKNEWSSNATAQQQQQFSDEVRRKHEESGTEVHYKESK